MPAIGLLRTPEEERTGNVFKPIGEKGGHVFDESNISGTISAMGEKAGIIVDHRRTKYASAHNLRRTFGTRWSKEVPAIDLKELMRHAELKTTLTYYVDSDSQGMAERLWN